MTRDTRLLLVTDAVGGVWVYSLELARALRPMGIETVIAIMGPSPSDKRAAEAREFRVIDTGLPLDWLATDPGDLRRAGDRIADLANREGVDVVQTSSAALLADSRFDQPCVAVQHSCVATWWSAVKSGDLPEDFRWRRELVERGLNHAAAVVAPSKAFAAETVLMYDLRVPVLAVHNGRRPVRAPELAQADFVLTAGRLWDEGKNVATLDRAASRIAVPFEAAGAASGPNGASIELNHLHSLGEIDPARLAGLLAARPIFASAALYEPFGLAALEAAYSGCALVLSDIPTHREIWEGAAVFVHAHDHGAFSRAVGDLLDEPSERRRLGQLALARARSYTPERMARGMANIYARVTAPVPVEVAGAA